MIKNRRDLLKALALSPWFLAQPGSAVTRLFGSTDGPCHCVNILLHGFFFLEFQKDEFGKDMLVVASPSVNGHVRQFRDQGQQLQALDPSLDLRNELTPGSRLDFPDRMLCFSKKDINLQGNFIDLNKPYSFLMKLPPPRDIAPLRNGLRKDLPLAAGNVSRSITGLANGQKQVALVVRLKYDGTADNSSFPPARSYYEEHCHIATLDEMKATLNAARTVFGNAFDLDITAIVNAKVNSDDQSNLPDEITPDDERALLEISPCDEPAPPRDMSGLKLHSQPTDLGDNRTVEPAICPLFGVAP